VDLDEIDRIYIQMSYWLTPAKAQNAKAYSLLAAAMAATNRAVIANIVMGGRQHLCAVRASDGVLALEILHYEEQVQHPSAVTDLPEPAETEGPELDMARSLILAMSTDWQPEHYRDTYTEKVRQLVADKLADDDMTTKSAPPEPTNVTDLLDALRRSVEARYAS
jgi:DNA end-binding protein Ku